MDPSTGEVLLRKKRDLQFGVRYSSGEKFINMFVRDLILSADNGTSDLCLYIHVSSVVPCYSDIFNDKKSFINKRGKVCVLTINQ